MAYQEVSRLHTTKLIADGLEKSLPIKDMLDSLKKRYEVFYILPKTASHGGDKEVLAFWRALLGENVLEIDHEAAVCETIALTIGIREGRIDLEGGVDHLQEMGISDEQIIGSVSKALAKLPGSSVPATSSGAALAGLDSHKPASRKKPRSRRL
jgi:hypothetical protein